VKYGVVSSVSESCGNAAFTQIILDSLNNSGVDAVGIALNLDLTQSSDPNLVKLADDHIGEIAKSLVSLDGINIQYEPGLYGPSSSLIYKRLKTLLEANSNVVVTIHSLRLFTSKREPLLRQTLKYLVRMQFRSAVGYAATVRNSRNVAKQNRRCVDLFVKHNAKIIVHTRKSQNLLQKFWNYDQVFAHPLKFVDASDVTSNREDWLERLGLSHTDRLIGIFGYVSKYKGHDVALEALDKLPPQFKLVIAGRQHPQTLQEHMDIDAYLKVLLENIEKKSKKSSNPLNKRIIFLNELSDEALINLAASVDYSWLPYMEVGQDGSGIASILFDVSPRVIASNAKSFDELISLEPGYRCERFDVGNYLELASKTLRYEEYRNLQNLNYSLDSQRELYLDLLTRK
jgi:glycosyltransferase involved in cell wall biosynthesis